MAPLQDILHWRASGSGKLQVRTSGAWSPGPCSPESRSRSVSSVYRRNPRSERRPIYACLAFQVLIPGAGRRLDRPLPGISAQMFSDRSRDFSAKGLAEFNISYQGVYYSEKGGEKGAIRAETFF